MHTYITLWMMFLFRLDELGIKHFKKLIDTQEPLKMHVLLQFLLNEDILREHVRDAWCEIYDFEFIEQIISKNAGRALEMADLLDFLSNKATGHGTIIKVEDEIKEKKYTIPEPFNLTKPKPRKLPKYIVLERKIKVNPVQDVIYKNSLEQVMENNRKRKELIKEHTINKYDHENDPIKRLFQ